MILRYWKKRRGLDIVIVSLTSCLKAAGAKEIWLEKFIIKKTTYIQENNKVEVEELS